MNRVLSFTAALIMVWIIGYLLIVGRGLLIPVVIAILIWHLLNTVNLGIKSTPTVGKYLPPGISMLLALILVVLFIKVLFDIIGDNVNEVIAVAPRYQENLLNIFNKLDQRFHIKSIMNLDTVIKNLSIQNVLLNIYSVFSTLTSSAVLIFLYVVFLFIEQHFFTQKLNVLFPQKEHRQLVDKIINQIMHDTQTYLGIKTMTSLLTAFASWLVMKWVGLDFAAFWALLIFFLNFIPNLGAIIATAFPAILALVQFQGWLPFFEVTTGIILIQVSVGSFIEPRLLGHSLNLSPFVILFALALWGTIWGVLGMLLSVPITVMMMILFAHFKSTKPIAVLLSQDGMVK